MAWGFFKKLVIADNVGLVADKVFALEAPAFEILWAGVFAFAIQIYADFSAYSDIARGTARWFGFELMVNFDHPYMARGPQDFWRRWHISLSTWFRDYVYIPLGGSRHGFGRELAQHHGDVRALGLLARRQLELRPVGRVSRPAAGGQPPPPPRAWRRSGLPGWPSSRRCRSPARSCWSASAG